MWKIMKIKGMVLCVSFKSFKRHGTYYDSYLSEIGVD